MKRLAINYLVIAALIFAAAFTSCNSMGSVIPSLQTEENLHPLKKTKWGTGITNGGWETPPTRLVVMKSSRSSSKKYTRAVFINKILKIRYVGEKKRDREPQEMEYYFPNYETTAGSDYEIIDSDTKGCASSTFFLYNDSEKWGGVPDNIIYSIKDEERPTANKADIAAMEKQQNGRKIIYSEIIAEFSIDRKSNRLMLVRYQNTTDGLFQIVLRDHSNDYFTADYPSGLDEDGLPNWRADLPDEPGHFSILFIGRVAEGLFIVMEWGAPEGNSLEVFVAKNGKLKTTGKF